MNNAVVVNGEKSKGNRLLVLLVIFAVFLIGLAAFWLSSGGSSRSLAERRLISALSLYQKSKWSFQGAYDAVYGENEEIDMSEITNAGNKDDVDDIAKEVIGLFKTRSERIEEERLKINNEIGTADRIKRSISAGLNPKQKKLATSLVKNIKILNGLELDLVDIYDEYTDSKILLAKNTKKLALNEIGVGEYNEFNNERNALIDKLSDKEKEIIEDLKDYGMRIDDDLYRLLLELE